VRRPKERSEASTELGPADLIERCKAGDQVAWTELVEATHREVYSLCLRILRDPDDAAEATQDAYLKAWRGLRGFRGEAMVTTWLYRVAANAAISKQRRRARKWQHEIGASDGDEHVAGSSDPQREVELRLELGAVETELARLPEHYRTAVVLRDVYGFNIEEMARQLDISETAAKVRVHRGRKKLKAALYRSEQGEDA
jgi:RNA polymerase sigma-70 factor, ECF subfamily